MDAQVIGVATAVASAAVAALGLLLTWYRREESKEEQKEERRSHWFFIAAAIGIVTLASLGVIFTFVLGARTKSTVAVTNNNSPSSSKLTEAQYRGKVGPVCSNAKEKGRRLEELKALKTIIGSEVTIEQEAVERIDSLQPPDELKSAHDDMVSVWERRVSRF